MTHQQVRAHSCEGAWVGKICLTQPCQLAGAGNFAHAVAPLAAGRAGNAPIDRVASSRLRREVLPICAILVTSLQQHFAVLDARIQLPVHGDVGALSRVVDIERIRAGGRIVAVQRAAALQVLESGRDVDLFAQAQ